MSDTEIYGVLRESMAGVRMRRPVDEIVAVGRGRRRRRRQVLAGVAVSGLAMGGVLALSLPGAGSSGAPATARPGTATTAPAHLELAGFTMDLDAFGNIEVVLSRPQLVAPRDLESAFAKFGVRAKVTLGKECVDPKNPKAAVHGVVRRAGPGTRWDVSPKQVPAGSTLYVGLFPRTSGQAQADLSAAVLPDSVAPVCGSLRKSG